MKYLYGLGSLCIVLFVHCALLWVMWRDTRREQNEARKKTQAPRTPCN